MYQVKLPYFFPLLAPFFSQMSIASYFGGYMPHCFESADETTYVPRLVENAREAIFHGRWFTKVDGGSGLLIFNEHEQRYDLYRRYDDKKNKFQGIPPPGYIHLPTSKNPSVYKGRQRTHRYFLKFQPRTAPFGKGSNGGEAAIWRELYSQIDREFIEGKSLDGLDWSMPMYHSLDLVGKNFSATPGVDKIGIALLADQEILEKPSFISDGLKEGLTDEQVYEHFKEYFCTVACQGIIIEYQGMYWRILASHFGSNVLWNRDKNLTPQPVLMGSHE